jgi:AbiJ N-terminal domain 4
MSGDQQNKPTFSQRMGLSPVRTALQVDSMDEALRNSLWNVLTAQILDPFFKSGNVKGNTLECEIVRRIWRDHLKSTMDSLGPDTRGVLKDLRKYFFELSWNGVYDLLEFIANSYRSEDFCRDCNFILKRECAGYRFVGTTIGPIVADSEIKSIETALLYGDTFKPVSTHLSTALQLLSDRVAPDCRNSVKESISAVEAACRIVTGDDKATLGKAVKKLQESGVKIHPAFEGALKRMYGYTSDAEGIRHALLAEPTLDSADAIFMLVSCSAFVNYLKAKSSSPKLEGHR